MRPTERTADRLRTVPERAPLFKWGGWATVFYLFGISFLAWNFETSLLDLQANELGDFLAGAFSPLAFLWLVLGFLQQGQELRIQAIELNNSVEQSRQLVEVTRSQLELERETLARVHAQEKELAKPQFRLTGGAVLISGTNVKFKYEITNVGGECSDIVLFRKEEDEPRLELRKLDHMRKDSLFDVSMRLNVSDTPHWTFFLQYSDVEGHRHQVSSRAWYSPTGAGHDVMFAHSQKA